MTNIAIGGHLLKVLALSKSRLDLNVSIALSTLFTFCVQSLRDMLGEAVTPILLECLEPPDIFNIERSFRSLYESNFVSDPTDEGEITSLGSLVVALG